jgi:hypothetical protein
MNKNKRYNTTQKRMSKKPRSAYCNGCGVTFKNHHKLQDHRRTFRCGGSYLTHKERMFIDKLRLEREAQERRRRQTFALVKEIREGKVPR